jgi:hypothetical protein
MEPRRRAVGSRATLCPAVRHPRFTKRFAHGFSFDTNYVWSKFLSNYDSSGWGSRNGTNTIQNSFARNTTYSLSNFDVPQNWKGSVIYALPFGKGHKLLGNNAIADAILGGWQVSSLYLYQSGNVFTVAMNSNNTNSQANSQYPNVVPGVPLYPANKTAAMWFNPAAFSAPPNTHTETPAGTSCADRDIPTLTSRPVRRCMFRSGSAVRSNSGSMRPTLSTTPASVFQTPASEVRPSGRLPARNFRAAPYNSAPVSPSNGALSPRRTAALRSRPPLTYWHEYSRNRFRLY